MGYARIGVRILSFIHSFVPVALTAGMLASVVPIGRQGYPPSSIGRQALKVAAKPLGPKRQTPRPFPASDRANCLPSPPSKALSCSTATEARKIKSSRSRIQLATVGRRASGRHMLQEHMYGTLPATHRCRIITTKVLP